MTVKQFERKADSARRYGSAVLEDGDVLICHAACDWSLRRTDGGTIDTAHDPSKWLTWYTGR